MYISHILFQMCNAVQLLKNIKNNDVERSDFFNVENARILFPFAIVFFYGFPEVLLTN